MKVTLDDVAKLANVSKTTVSRVINDRGYLSQETIERVYAAMNELNYQPNAMARQLSLQKTNIIGLLFPTISNPFFGELVEELEKKLYKKGFKVLIGNAMHDAEKENNYLNQLLSKQVDGLIVGTHNQGIEAYDRYTGLPIVSIERNMSSDIPVIASDNYAGGVLATEQLVARGAKKIIHTNGKTALNMPGERRQTGYEDTMRQHGLEPIIFTIYFDMTISEKKARFYQLFKEYPDVEGIFAGNDVDAALILEIARTVGRRIPEDLMVIGFDGTSIVRAVQPQLATIVQPIEAMAEKAIDVLQRRLENKETEKEYILPVTFYAGAIQKNTKKKEN